MNRKITNYSRYGFIIPVNDAIKIRVIENFIQLTLALGTSMKKLFLFVSQICFLHHLPGKYNSREGSPNLPSNVC